MALELNSAHPLAQAIVRAANRPGIAAVKQAGSVAGGGMHGVIDDREYWIGSADFVQREARIAFGAGQSPNAVTDEDFERAREFYDDAQLAAIVAAASFFGYLNRWNDTVATALEDEPLAFAAERLGGESWEPGKHAG